MGIKIEGWKILKGNENAKNGLNVLNVQHRAKYVEMMILKDAHPVNFDIIPISEIHSAY